MMSGHCMQDFPCLLVNLSLYSVIGDIFMILRLRKDMVFQIKDNENTNTYIYIYIYSM